MLYPDLTFNLTLLVAISIVSGFIEKHWSRHASLGALSQGVLFGGAAVWSMLQPMDLGAGLIFDDLSILVSLCALFFGPWAAAAVGAITMVCRIWMGGAVLAGSLAILSSAGIGLLAHFRLKPKLKPPTVGSLYLLGLAVQLTMLPLMFPLPGGVGQSVVMRIGLPVMLLYPLATILAGKILSDQVDSGRVLQSLREFAVSADSTERRRAGQIMEVRLHLMLFADTHSLAELLQATLDEAEALTGSVIGFYHFLDADQKTLTLQAWSTNTLEKMCTAEGKGRHYSIDEAGVWVDCVRERRPVIHNDYAALPHRKGMPKGHAPVGRELVTPVFRGGKIVAILGVGNKPADYDQNDRKAIEMLADLAWSIAERKLAEDSLRSTNRKLKTLSDCNQTLLRAVDEQTLLDEICRIICDQAGYLLAWVGYAEHDEAKTLRPVAWAGFDSGYVANAKLTWSDDTERGQGPAGRAIRTGKTIYVQDFATDPQMAPWRERALQRGYRSGISLPLRDESAKVFGVLLIYSSEPNSISPDEIHLMEELASDLAFGITALRIRAERKRAEMALEESEAKMRSILDNIEIGVALISPKMEILELNQRMREWFPSIDLGQRPICYRAFNEPPREVACDCCPICKTLQDGLVYETTTQKPWGSAMRNYRIVSSPVFNAPGDVATAIELLEDITEKLSLESQFRQAQKMESVGRLAGGVAHDFNNMLGVIIGHTDMALEDVEETHPLFVNLQEIRKAAERSAGLTRQLLAFARKQVVAPRVLELNETVEGMLKMLRCLIGEDINLVWLPGLGGWSVKVDPTQIDQILANLCVNARDAIAGTGKVTIETHAVAFDETYCTTHPGFFPGEYVLLAVSDSGCGMDKETLGKLFEPFFTTKEVGKGTGLGLATVYGIVKQNNGFITVDSEPGHGAFFNIYLPRHSEKTEQTRKESQTEPSARGHETILAVEDEPVVLNMTGLMLKRLGYRVLAASTPGEAIRKAKEHAGEIHLLITDVVMPEMNGQDLAKTIASIYPKIRRLYMSGYTGDVIARHGVLNEGVNYLQKPFSIQALTFKVREALEGE